MTLTHSNCQASTAVILFDMGGPGSRAEIEPYLKELFSDHDLIRMPLGFLYQRRLAQVIAAKRAPKVAHRYESIGYSPLTAATSDLAHRIAQACNLPVRYSMRYTKPRVVDVVEDLKAQKIDRLILLPLYPQYSSVTTASSLSEFQRVTGTHFTTTIIRDHHEHPAYINVMTMLLQESLSRVKSDGKRHVLFAAHSIPTSYVKRGDPYVKQIRRTAELIAQSIPSDVTYSLAFQSRLGPVKWQGPPMSEELNNLVAKKTQHLIVQPLSFVSENLETLYDLDLEFRRHCLTSGIATMTRVPTPGASLQYSQALALIVSEVVNTWRKERKGASS